MNRQETMYNRQAHDPFFVDIHVHQMQWDFSLMH